MSRSSAPPKPYVECSTCALRNEPLVQPFHHTQADVAIVGEAPGLKEVEEGRPFAGRSGAELSAALAPHRGNHKLHITNAVMCRPPRNELGKVRAQAKARGLVDPVKACRPRLLKELEPFDKLITLGSTALEAVVGARQSILNVRGFPFELRSSARILPTVHPAFVMRSGRYRHVFRSDISKAFRHFSDQLSWKLPKAYYAPSAEAIRLFGHEVFRRKLPLSLDVETDGLEATTCNLRCVGIGAEGIGILVVPFRSVDAGVALPLITPAQRSALFSILAAPSTELIGHNAGYYDRMVLEKEFAGELQGREFLFEDTILMHHGAESELPHRLGFVASVHTDISAWKEERGALDYENDQDLWKYNAKDVAVTMAIAKPLKADLELKGQEEIYERDKRLQSLCVDLHRIGITVDRDAVARHRKAFEDRAALAANQLRRVVSHVAKRRSVGLEDFNPGSPQQVATLLFDVLKLPYKEEYETETGARGTSMQVVRDLLVQSDRSPLEKKTLTLVHQYRRATKFLGSFLSPEVLADVRVHANFNAHVTVSGRLSGDLQQVPNELRDIYVAGPGHILVASDMDQIELRTIAALAGVKKYLEVFSAGGDAHAVTADLIYGPKWRQLEETQKTKQRDFGKRFSFANAYGAGERTVHEQMKAVEGKDGGFPYLDTTIGQVISLRDKWFGGVPEIPRWWDACVDEYREKGCVTDCIWGRKRFFLDGLDRNAIVNFPVQTASVSIVHDGTFELMDRFGIVTGFDGIGTGIVHQVHDQVIVECKDRPTSIAQVKEALTECLNREYAQLPVAFTSTPKVGHSWLDVK